MLVKLDLRELREKNEPETYILAQSNGEAGSSYWTRRLPEKSMTQEIYHCQKIWELPGNYWTNIVEKQVKNNTKCFDNRHSIKKNTSILKFILCENTN